MEKIILKAKTRTLKGKQVKQIRNQNELPVVLYGHGIEPRLLTIDQLEFNLVYDKAGGSTLVSLKIDDAKEDVNILFHQVDLNPFTDSPIHADLLQVKMNEKIKTDVTLHLVGNEDAPVVKEKEGTIVLNKDSVEVEAFPQDLVSEIEVDVTALTDFDQTIHVKDLVIPNKITVLDDPEDIVVTVQEPRSEEELAELDEEVKEDVETVEVEEKGKEEETETGEESKE